MDISFLCDKCRQHLVVDEAGAGLSVPCPSCGAELTVPKPMPPAPLRNMALSDQLYRQCRDLVYELRVEDALRVLKEAEKALAQEKGYQLDATFGFYGSAQSLIEPAKRAISRSLQNLTPKEERAILGAAVCGKLNDTAYLHTAVGGAEDEILVATLGSELQWPAFAEQFHRYKESGRWPEQWEVYPVGKDESVEDFYGQNLGQPTDPLLAKIHGLSVKARRLLLDGSQGWTEAWRSRLNYGNDCGDYSAVIEELVSAGFAVPRKDMSLAERLCLLQIAKVRELQRAQGVKGARSKEQIAKNLLASVAEETLAAEVDTALAADGFWADTYVKLNVGYRQLDRYWFEYARAKLLAHSLFKMFT